MLYHIIILTSNTNDYSEYEEQYYKEDICLQDTLQFITSNYQYKKSKIFLKDNHKNDNTELNVLRKNNYTNNILEYKIFRGLIKCFIKKNYSKIGFIYGGIKGIKEFCKKFSVSFN